MKTYRITVHSCCTYIVQAENEEAAYEAYTNEDLESDEGLDTAIHEVSGKEDLLYLQQRGFI